MKILFALVSAWLFLAPTVEAESIRIALATQSSVKSEAVRESFEQSFPGKRVEVMAYPASSYIPEQPIGVSLALRGARNRLSQLPDDSVDYQVSIENYIDYDGGWKDRAVIIIRENSVGKESIVYSEETEVPAKYVSQAQKEKITVGQAVHNAYPYLNPSDWHAHFGGISRKEHLKSAIFKGIHANEIQQLKNKVCLYQDFPKQGILFQDFSPILRDKNTFLLCIGLLQKRYSNKPVDAVIGLESRGFILGGALAYQLGVPFIPVRKAGKIPGEVFVVDYEKEYGKDSFCIARDAISKGQNILIVDDLIATGGSAKAAIELVRLAGGIPMEFLSLLEIKELSGRQNLGIPSFNLID